MLHFKQYHQTPLDSAHTESLPGLSPACICRTSLPRFSKVPCGFCDDKEGLVIPEEPEPESGRPEPRTCPGLGGSSVANLLDISFVDERIAHRLRSPKSPVLAEILRRSVRAGVAGRSTFEGSLEIYRCRED